MTQCPGEAYSEFWEEDNTSNFDIEELTKNKRWNGKDWENVPLQYRIDYRQKNDTEVRRQYHKTMPMAISVANLLITRGDYEILSINPEYPSIGQD
jgi:hypothetical protein